MIDLLKLLLAVLASLFRSRAELEAENLVLRQQVNVLRRRMPKRPALTNIDRLLFVWLYRWFPSTVGALAIVRPETIIRWHRVGFRAYWRWRSPNRVGSGRNRMLPDTIFRLVPRSPSSFVAPHVGTLINIRSFRPAIRKLASGSALSMPGISKKRLASLDIPVPHLPLQTAFAEQIARIEATTSALTAATAKAESMAAALSAKVFA